MRNWFPFMPISHAKRLGPEQYAKLSNNQGLWHEEKPRRDWTH